MKLINCFKIVYFLKTNKFVFIFTLHPTILGSFFLNTRDLNPSFT